MKSLLEENETFTQIVFDQSISRKFLTKNQLKSKRLPLF